MNLSTEFYKKIIMQTKRGNNHGIISNAKPIFVLTIIEAISEGFIIGNKILFNNIELIGLYKSNYIKYNNKGNRVYRNAVNITPFRMPYFHLNAEPYYHIKWKEKVVPPKQSTSPSNKFLANNVDYSYMDDELWRLLQSLDVRNELINTIINHFLSHKYSEA